jgi:protein-disulfide isomerase
MTAYSPRTRYSGFLRMSPRKLLLLVIASAGLALPAQADIKPDTADLVYGKADAPVTIVEYAALTCPHCAHFHTDVLPELKKKYIDTGAVKLVFRDFPFEGLGLRAHMLARCAGPERRVGFMDVLFKQQKTWASAPDPIKALQQVAKIGGIGEADFNACMTSKSAEEAVLKNRMEGEQKDKVTSTPTLFVNGQKYTGNRNVEELSKVLDPLLKDWKPKSG